MLNKLWTVTSPVPLLQHKKIVFMVYVVGMLMESIARDGPAGPEHWQCFRVDASVTGVGVGEFDRERSDKKG